MDTNLNMIISGSGEMEVAGIGTMDHQEIKISGSGNIHAYDAPVNKSDITISGSGSAYVNVLQSLVANISGSGDITYMGTPTITTNISGSGNVRPY